MKHTLCTTTTWQPFKTSPLWLIEQWIPLLFVSHLPNAFVDVVHSVFFANSLVWPDARVHGKGLVLLCCFQPFFELSWQCACTKKKKKKKKKTSVPSHAGDNRIRVLIHGKIWTSFFLVPNPWHLSCSLH